MSLLHAAVVVDDEFVAAVAVPVLASTGRCERTSMLQQDRVADYCNTRCRPGLW